MKKALMSLGLLLCLLTSIHATDYYVDAVNGSNVTGNGTKEKPWYTITYALGQVSGQNHTIHVAPGIYNNSLETFPINMKNSVSLVGAGAEFTILDAESTNTVIVCEDITNKKTRIEGFTITGGYPPWAQGIEAGGIHIKNSSPIIVNNNIISNVGNPSSAAGIECLSGSSPIIEFNTIKNNIGKWGNTVHGIETRNKNSNPIIRYNTIENHTKAGIECSWDSFPFIKGNVIRNNTHGIECNLGGKATIEMNVISENGRGIDLEYNNVIIERNVILNNSAFGIFLEGGTIGSGPGPILTNNTIDGNGSDGIRLSDWFGKIDISLVKNNIISNNSGYGIKETGANAEMKSVEYNLFYNNTYGHYLDKGTDTYSNVEDMNNNLPECRWNLEGDPRFMDPYQGNYNLLSDSPAIDAGAPNSPPDPDGSRADIGALSVSVPAPPSNFRAIEGNSKVTLFWNPAFGLNFAYYVIYRSQTSGSPKDSLVRITKLDSSFVDTEVTNFNTYYYRICAVDSITETILRKSQYSNEVSAYPHPPDTLHFYVDDDAIPPGKGTEIEPWKTITFALSQINLSGEDIAIIHVQPGRYWPTLGETFPIKMKNRISIVGTDPATTILDANKSSHVIECIGISYTNTTLEGFTIKNGLTTSSGGAILITSGSALTVQNNIITSNIVSVERISTEPKSEMGGGIFVLNSSPKIIQNQIINNTVGAKDINKTGSGGHGGGIAVSGEDSSPLIFDNVIKNNQAKNTSFASAFGGGIYVGDMASATITKNIISEKSIRQLSATSGPTAGGGIYISTPQFVKISNDSIINNTASAQYGSITACSGIYIDDNSDCMINNNVVARNDSNGITLVSSSVEIINNTIAFNEQDGIYLLNESSPTIINNILAFNSRHGIHENSYGDDPTSVEYNLFYSNGNGLYFDEGHQVYYDVPTLETNAPECKNNLEGDPLFVSTINEDYHLQIDSPCIDAGHPDHFDREDPNNSGYALYPSQGMIRSDIGAYGGQEAHDITKVKESSKGVSPTPFDYTLSQNYPNPFNPETTIRYELSKPSEISIKIYNITGQLVKTLIDQKQAAGNYSILWNGKDQTGRNVASGVYFYQMNAKSISKYSKQNFVQTKKMILVR